MSVKYVDEAMGLYDVRINRPPTWYGRQADGYGRKIVTEYQIRLNGEKRWRRVYAVCFSNAASHYITIKGQDYYLKNLHTPTGEAS